jgi:tetraacyldisaccharide 4'-kinase
MGGKAPPFWWQPAGGKALALAPAAALYAAIARHRLRNGPRAPVDIAVVCVGNLTVGGSGKTPVSIGLAKAAAAMGLKPGFLSRGHGARLSRPLLVAPDSPPVVSAGDEPLLLAGHAPVAVTPDRAAGARLLIEHGCDIAIMDDGFQSARIRMDHAILVVDALFGIGNGRVLPAGPLRAAIADQMPYADSILRMGQGSAADGVIRLAARAGKPVHTASVRPLEPERLAGRRLLAFAGIGHPVKFFDTVRAAGADVVQARAFPDHHPYSEAEIRRLMEDARGLRAALVTTAKDAARLRGSAFPGLDEMLEVLEIEVVFDDPHVPERIVEAAMAAYGRRKLAGRT